MHDNIRNGKRSLSNSINAFIVFDDSSVLQQKGAYFLHYVFLDHFDMFSIVLKPMIFVAKVGEILGIDL
jgi:hypothetical protein